MHPGGRTRAHQPSRNVRPQKTFESSGERRTRPLGLKLMCLARRRGFSWSQCFPMASPTDEGWDLRPRAGIRPGGVTLVAGPRVKRTRSMSACPRMHQRWNIQPPWKSSQRFDPLSTHRGRHRGRHRARRAPNRRFDAACAASDDRGHVRPRAPGAGRTPARIGTVPRVVEKKSSRVSICHPMNEYDPRYHFSYRISDLGHLTDEFIYNICWFLTPWGGHSIGDLGLVS